MEREREARNRGTRAIGKGEVAKAEGGRGVGKGKRTVHVGEDLILRGRRER